MTSFEYTLPTTGAFFFPSCLRTEPVDDDVLTMASNYRAQLRDILKRLKRSDSKDILSVIRIIEEYLPSLFRIFHNVTDDVERGAESFAHATPTLPKITALKPMITSWRATFYDNKVPGKAFPRLDFRGIAIEVNFVLLTYAYALSNYAHSSSTELSNTTTLLTKAAGIFQHISERIAPLLEDVSIDRTCPEAFPEFSTFLVSMTLGDAQINALQQLKDKTSYSIVCRVAVAASDHYSRAIGTMSSHPMLKSIPSEFREHLHVQQRKALALAYQYLAREHAKGGSIGFALGCVEQAEKLHKLAENTDLYRELMKENRQVTFQPVSNADEVQTRLPSGRDFAKLLHFSEPGSADTTVTASMNYVNSAYY